MFIHLTEAPYPTSTSKVRNIHLELSATTLGNAVEPPFPPLTMPQAYQCVGGEHPNARPCRTRVSGVYFDPFSRAEADLVNRDEHYHTQALDPSIVPATRRSRHQNSRAYLMAFIGFMGIFLFG